MLVLLIIIAKVGRGQIREGLIFSGGPCSVKLGLSIVDFGRFCWLVLSMLLTRREGRVMD